MNLLLNAADVTKTMMVSSTGLIRLATEYRNDAVSLEVVDNGAGIEEKYLDKIFDLKQDLIKSFELYKSSAVDEQDIQHCEAFQSDLDKFIPLAEKVQNLALANQEAEAADKIAAGDLNVEVQVQSEKDILSKGLKKVVESLRSLIGEMDHMSKEHEAGDIDIVVPEEKFEGPYKAMAKGVNDMVAGHITVKKKSNGLHSRICKRQL